MHSVRGDVYVLNLQTTTQAHRIQHRFLNWFSDDLKIHGEEFTSVQPRNVCWTCVLKYVLVFVLCFFPPLLPMSVVTLLLKEKRESWGCPWQIKFPPLGHFGV